MRYEWDKLVAAIEDLEADETGLVAVEKLFVAWRNSDLTEGRGRNIPITVCESAFLAEKAAKGKSTQGSEKDKLEEKTAIAERAMAKLTPVEIDALGLRKAP